MRTPCVLISCRRSFVELARLFFFATHSLYVANVLRVHVHQHVTCQRHREQSEEHGVPCRAVSHTEVSAVRLKATVWKYGSSNFIISSLYRPAPLVQRYQKYI